MRGAHNKIWRLRSVCLALAAVAAGLILLTCPGDLRAAGPDLTDTGWQWLGRGIRWRRIKLTRPQGLFTATLRVYRFDPRYYGLEVVYVSESATAHQVLAGLRPAVAVINANFFNRAGRPLGLVIERGREIHLRRRLNSGVLWYRPGRVGITHVSRFRSARVWTAIQSWPRLIAAGRPTKGVKNAGLRHRRSLAAVDRSGRLLLAVTEGLTGGLSLAEVQAIFKRPGFNVRDLLNLDGGRSTQMSVRVGGHRFQLEGFDSVPVLLAVIRRRRR
jgi:uncharacterized protein YigE (DUF2233 family)